MVQRGSASFIALIGHNFFHISDLIRSLSSYYCFFINFMFHIVIWHSSYDDVSISKLFWIFWKYTSWSPLPHMMMIIYCDMRIMSWDMMRIIFRPLLALLRLSIIIDYHWLSMIIIDYHWLSLIVIDYHWLSLNILDYHWLSLNIIDSKVKFVHPVSPGGSVKFLPAV